MGYPKAITLHNPKDSPNPKNSKIYHESTHLLKANAANYEDTKLFCSFRVFHLSCFAAYALRRDVTVFFQKGAIR